MRAWGWKAESHCPALEQAPGSGLRDNPQPLPCIHQAPSSSLQICAEILVVFPELTSLGKFPGHFPSQQRLPQEKIPEEHCSSCYCKHPSPSLRTQNARMVVKEAGGVAETQCQSGLTGILQALPGEDPSCHLTGL